MEAESVSRNFGQRVHQLKTSRTDEGTSGPLGKEVSAMAHSRNAERQAERASVAQSVTQTGVVELNATDSANTDAIVTAIVTHNINNTLQQAGATNEASVTFRLATGGPSLNDVIRQGFASALSGYQQQNPAQATQSSVNNVVTLLQEGVENGFSEAEKTLASGGTLDEKGFDALNASKENALTLINELATFTSTTG